MLQNIPLNEISTTDSPLIKQPTKEVVSLDKTKVDVTSTDVIKVDISEKNKNTLDVSKVLNTIFQLKNFSLKKKE